MRDITTKIIGHVWDDKITEQELNIRTEQEFCFVQICKLINCFCVNVENICPFKKHLIQSYFTNTWKSKDQYLKEVRTHS